MFHVSCLRYLHVEIVDSATFSKNVTCTVGQRVGHGLGTLTVMSVVVIALDLQEKTTIFLSVQGVIDKIRSVLLFNDFVCVFLGFF